MRAKSVLLLVAMLGLAGCATVHTDGDYRYPAEIERPVYGTHYDHDGYEHVYSTTLGVYTVVGVPNVYFHDGSAESLDQAIEVMARYQLGRTISEQDVRLIISQMNGMSNKILK